MYVVAIQEDDWVNIQRIPVSAQLYLYKKNIPKKDEKISSAIGFTIGRKAYKRLKEETLKDGEDL